MIKQKWSDELTLLTEIAVTQPQAAYTCFVSGYQHRFSYFIRTIPKMEEYLQPIKDIIRHQFIPAITGGKVVNDLERSSLSLPPNMRGLGLKNVCEIAPIEHENSKQFTKQLQHQILNLPPASKRYPRLKLRSNFKMPSVSATIGTSNVFQTNACVAADSMSVTHYPAKRAASLPSATTRFAT